MKTATAVWIGKLLLAAVIAGALLVAALTSRGEAAEWVCPDNAKKYYLYDELQNRTGPFPTREEAQEILNALEEDGQHWEIIETATPLELGTGGYVVLHGRRHRAKYDSYDTGPNRPDGSSKIHRWIVNPAPSILEKHRIINLTEKTSKGRTAYLDEYVCTALPCADTTQWRNMRKIWNASKIWENCKRR